MRVFLPPGEQIHQGGAAVSETDQSGKRLRWCSCQAHWVLGPCLEVVERTST